MARWRDMVRLVWHGHGILGYLDSFASHKSGHNVQPSCITHERKDQYAEETKRRREGYLLVQEPQDRTANDVKQ